MPWLGLQPFSPTSHLQSMGCEAIYNAIVGATSLFTHHTFKVWVVWQSIMPWLELHPFSHLHHTFKVRVVWQSILVVSLTVILHSSVTAHCLNFQSDTDFMTNHGHYSASCLDNTTYTLGENISFNPNYEHRINH